MKNSAFALLLLLSTFGAAAQSNEVVTYPKEQGKPVFTGTLVSPTLCRVEVTGATPGVQYNLVISRPEAKDDITKLIGARFYSLPIDDQGKGAVDVDAGSEDRVFKTKDCLGELDRWVAAGSRRVSAPAAKAPQEQWALAGKRTHGGNLTWAVDLRSVGPALEDKSTHAFMATLVDGIGYLKPVPLLARIEFDCKSRGGYVTDFWTDTGKGPKPMLARQLLSWVKAPVPGVFFAFQLTNDDREAMAKVVCDKQTGTVYASMEEMALQGLGVADLDVRAHLDAIVQANAAVLEALKAKASRGQCATVSAQEAENARLKRQAYEKRVASAQGEQGSIGRLTRDHDYALDFIKRELWLARKCDIPLPDLDRVRGFALPKSEE